jgi:hypothetical protein
MVDGAVEKTSYRVKKIKGNDRFGCVSTDFAGKYQGFPGEHMENLHQASFNDLIDMLSTQTAIYMTMLRNRATREEFEKCRDGIKQIQLEIEQRKSVNDQVSFEGPDSTYTSNLSL